MERSSFRLGRLDHVHLRVPDRSAALEWYRVQLGFEPVERFAFWADEVDGGPLQISADGGDTMLALFEATADHPMAPNTGGVAFSTGPEAFMAFARSLPRAIESQAGTPLSIDDIVDFDLCWAYEFVDPWQNRFEINCYDYDLIRTSLIEADDITPVRYWPNRPGDRGPAPS